MGNLTLIILLLLGFPFVSQQGETARYQHDCHSAAISMVTMYYGVWKGRTVEEIQEDMVGRGSRANYVQVVEYLEQEYNLQVEVVTTYQPTKDSLVAKGYKGAENIRVVDNIPNDVPVIWIYTLVPHWVVRFKGYNFDPYNGVDPFEDTAEKMNIYKPELGLGLIVRKHVTERVRNDNPSRRYLVLFGIR